MHTRRLGHTDIDLGHVGYGAMSFSNFYGPVDREKCFAILERCQEIGVTHLDTANLYGQGFSETVIGEYLAANPSARQYFSIATKGGIWIGDKADNDGFNNNNSPQHLEEQLDLSLARLGVEAVDLYYVHRLDERHGIEEVTETLAGFVKAGKIRAIGFSEIAPGTLRRAAKVHPVAAVQSEYSLWTRAPELGLLQACEELGTTMVAFSPVGRGMLTDRPHSFDKVQQLPFLTNNPRFVEPNYSLNMEKIGQFQALARDWGVATATLATAWTLAKGPHVYPIPGTRFVEHLDEVAAAAQLALTPQQMAQIEQVLPAGWAHGDRYSLAQWKGQERYG